MPRHHRHRNPCWSRRYFSSQQQQQQEPESWLVVGDGDLSYSAWLAPQLDPQTTVALTASVWEDAGTHGSVYRNSTKHANTIQEAGHRVLFGVDATKLHEIQRSLLGGDNSRFDRVIFNFPHWPGKANIRYNRQLMEEFLASAVQVLRRHTGQVHVALLSGQCGIGDVKNDMDAWRHSWMVPQYAAHHGLLLHDVQPFAHVVKCYDQSSHRGVDRAFSAALYPQRYVFGFPQNDDDATVPPEYQMACRHELRFRLDPERLAHDDCPYTVDALLHTDAVPGLVRSCVPHGIHVELPLRDVVHPKERSSSPLLVFLVVYAGAGRPLTREAANVLRGRVEAHVGHVTGLDVAKAGRPVSKPFPYALLERVKEEYNVSDRFPSTTSLFTWSPPL